MTRTPEGEITLADAAATARLGARIAVALRAGEAICLFAYTIALLFLPKVLASHDFDEHTVLVGHSGGAALLLAVLERIDATVSQAILVAGYCTQPNTEDEPVLQGDYDWAAIKAHVRELYFINSRHDPYGCDDTQGRSMFERLGGTQIVRDDGHFGGDQPYETFELLDRLIT